MLALHYPRRMRAKEGVAVTATVMAVAAPMLVVHWGALGPGLLAQILAVFLWGLVIVAWAVVAGPVRVPWRALAPLLIPLALVALGVVGSALAHGAPPGVWAGSLAVLGAAAAAAIAGAHACRHHPEWATRALMWGLVLAAGASLVIAVLQLAAPGWGHPLWVAPTRTPGRASANLVQPNHLATLLVWAWLAVALWPGRAGQAAPTRAVQGGASVGATPERGTPGADWAATAAPAPSAGAWVFLFGFALQAGVVATASRAGLVACLVLAVWAALDLRLPRPSAWLVWTTALGGLAITLGRALLAPASSLGAGASLVRPGARSGVFVDTLELLREHTLFGVGWREFQLAWSLAPLGDRGPRYYEHPHNLVLNLMVELGVPLGLAITVALCWGAVALLRSINQVAPMLRPRALMLAAMLGAVGVQSLFDAPFWHAHLLLPAAWAWGCLVGLGAGPAKARHPPPFAGPPLPDRRDAKVRVALVGAGTALTCAATLAGLDFRQLLPEGRAAKVGTAAAPVSAAPPPRGRSRLFGHYADHQHALRAPDASPDLFRSARWVTIDTPLLAAWIGALERAGRHDEARYLMQRALEFRDPAFAPWLAACRAMPAQEAPPSRCQAPARQMTWRDFR